MALLVKLVTLLAEHTSYFTSKDKQVDIGNFPRETFFTHYYCNSFDLPSKYCNLQPQKLSNSRRSTENSQTEVSMRALVKESISFGEV